MGANMKKRIDDVFRKRKKSPLTKKELAAKAKIKKNEISQFNAVLESMCEEGLLLEKKHKYYSSLYNGFIPGEIVKVNATFGFVRPDGYENDLFVPGHALMGAMPKDRVLIKKKKGKGELDEAVVVAVLQQADNVFSGTLVKEDGACAVIPDTLARFPIKVKKSSALEAQNGDKVLVKLISRGDRHFDHVAKVIRVFGDSEKADNCCEAIVAASGANTVFNKEVQMQADLVASKPIDIKEIAKREDLRFERIFTIDSADSKDLDDAVSLTKYDDGWELGVHIADVSHYVRPGTPLDDEAFERGTSIYYADRVIPMLPKELSNGICSLNPNEDRLAFSAIMWIGKDGELKDFKFKKSVIRSRVKGVYSEINSLIDGSADNSIKEKYAGLEDMIFKMYELSELLSKKRADRGGVELESVESKVILDENRMAVDIKPRERGKSEEMIENFMLMANQAAATLAMREQIPFVYRVHDLPTPEKLANLSELLTALNLDDVKPSSPVTSAMFAAILNKVKGTKQSVIINNQLLRSMAKAIYSEKNIGHFGLVLENYAHFTSPIRRYPDLCIHRIMSAFLLCKSEKDKLKLVKKYSDFVVRAAQHSSETEQRAMNIERDCDDCYKAEYIKNYIGEEYEGIISSVTAKGIYVELPNTVEGMVNINTLEPGFEYDGKVSLKNILTSKSYMVGDSVKIRVEAANVSAGLVDFSIVEE